jgi:hypothetical protein
LYTATLIVYGEYTRADIDDVTHFKRSLEIYISGAYHPAITVFKEMLHGHMVEFFHLLITGSKYIIEVFTVVYMVKHVDIIRSYGKFGFKNAVLCLFHSAKIGLKACLRKSQSTSVCIF